jgi:hypothetical protein
MKAGNFPSNRTILKEVIWQIIGRRSITHPGTHMLPSAVKKREE